MPSIPSYLIFLTLVLVVIPSVAAIVLRFALYKHLVFLQERVGRLITRESPGKQPLIVKELETRFKQASEHLDHVNTAALIDQVYSREKVGFLYNEQIDYFCRILPNLLLALGLLGTFLGITINLSALSQTINQSSANNVSTLVAQLEKPLGGMSIAFTTSLTGLAFSGLLTVVNFLFNTSLAKYRLISTLEDYLDNIYQPTIDSHTRLDKAVDRMVSLQNEFLNNFGNNVRDVVEQSLGKVAKEIAEENKKANELARLVYETFAQSTGILSAAATEFKLTSEELQAISKIFHESAEIFQQSQFPEKLSEATANLSNIQDKFSQSTANLAETVTAIKNAVNELHLSTQELLETGGEISRINKTSLKVLEGHQINQNSLFEIIPLLKQAAQSFDSVIIKIDKLEQKLTNKSDSLDGVEVALQELLKTVINYTKEVNSAIESLGERLIANISDNIGINNQYIQTVITNFERQTNQLKIIIDTLKLDLMELLKDNNINLTGEYKNIGNRLIIGMKQEAEISLKTSQVLAGKIQECVKQLAEIKQEIYKLRQLQANTDFKNNANSDDLADLASLFND